MRYGSEPRALRALSEAGRCAHFGVWAMHARILSC